MQNQLQKNGLSYAEAMGISVAIMAPTAAMALNGSFVASISGVSVPLTFLVAMVTIGLVSYAFIKFNGHFSSSGSVYAFTTVSLGPKAGFLSGWSLLLTYLVFTGASAAEIGAFMQSFLSYVGANVGWFPIALISVVLIWILALLDVRISARVMLLFEGISIVLILILSLVILSRGGAAHHLSPLPFTLAGNKVQSIGLATVFAFLSFAGFEGASSLGEETANPRRAIPISIASAVLITGFFYVLVSYAQSIGFGLTAEGVKAFAGSSAPLGELAKSYMSSGFAAAIMFGASLSAFSSALGTATTGSRLLFAMGRDGFIHQGLGTVHRKYKTPHVALSVVMLIGLVLVIALYRQPGTNVFGWLGSIGVLALLIAYLATNVGGIVYFVRQGSWRGGVRIVPMLAILALAYTLYSNVYPVPTGITKYFPYIVIAWIVIGVIVVMSSPHLVRNIGQRLAEEDSVVVREE
ncbi:APC family permease [Alicyclobacillus fastidiosus]|uniref:APC family permease n=1 Tax=Alicyclobacillus fastidiosus TaxID=392011 RepID=A0ABV5ALJ4_9BACL|nr:APC family permease [Alicyclobacillus fastidiosus]WEH10217.1 APC family permease [Alicyclobacillus fastidiosus]